MENHIIKEDHMHGSMFVLLKRFIENSFDFSTWVRLLEDAHIDRSTYQMQEMYPTSEIAAIVESASKLTGISTYELMEQYGEFIVPDLMLIYNKYVDPEWRTYEMLLHTEEAMHSAVRREDNRATPPKVLVTKKGNKQLIVDYFSKRKMSCVATGIIKGIARHFHESDLVVVTPLTPADQERVQIRVEFLS